MFNRFARIPGNRRTAPLLLVVGHHQPWTIAPDSLLNWTGRASRSAGGCPTRICTGASRAHPIANTAAAPETERIATTANRRFLLKGENLDDWPFDAQDRSVHFVA